MENSWGVDDSMGVPPPFSPGTEKEGQAEEGPVRLGSAGALAPFHIGRLSS